MESVTTVEIVLVLSYTVRRKGAIWHLYGCQTNVQKTTPSRVPHRHHFPRVPNGGTPNGAIWDPTEGSTTIY